MVKAYLSLGSNMGDKKDYIDEALKRINGHEAIEVIKTSSYYETDPVGYIDQDIFLNVVTMINTTLTPYELLAYCNQVEEELHRKRIIRWGPRTIDIDLLLYENFQSQDEKLTIPHPRMTERAFVMVPLWEIDQEVNINGLDIAEVMKGLPQEGIKKVDY